MPFFDSASLTSNRSAKSESASITIVRSTGAASWLRIVSSSWKPLLTVRCRITESFESTYTVPVPGTRKKRLWKYWRSSTESGDSRSPPTVSTHVDRKRVSNENRPVGSVIDASMSPRSSLTTNVLPLRILTCAPSTSRQPAVSLGAVAARETASGPPAADRPRRRSERAPQRGRHRVVFATHEPIEQLAVGLHRAVSLARAARHRDVAAVDGHEPVFRSLPSTMSNRTRPVTPARRARDRDR